MNKKVFVTRNIPAVGLDILRGKGFEVDVWSKKRAPSRRELIRELRSKPYDAVLCLLTDTIDAEIFDAAPSVKIYANYAAGMDNIDIVEATKRGITVTNTPNVSSQAVAEHAVALMLGLTTRMVEADAFMRKGKYIGWDPMNLIGTDLSGKVVGIVGTGSIGSHTARIMKHGFGARIIYFDAKPNEEIESSLGAVRFENIDDLLAESDFVSLHVPLLESTHHLLNANRLHLMKRSAFLINTSRGPVVDEDALVQALKDGVIAGAGLDVFEHEPRLARGLSKLSNVILTPHIASARQSIRDQMAVAAAGKIIDHLSLAL
ncbi:MAG: D-glycerate dehydrogenase [bacterium]|nr:D-glycerate dehydrogenase [bacterium]